MRRGLTDKVVVGRMETSRLDQRLGASFPRDSRSGRVGDGAQRSDCGQDNEENSASMHGLCDVAS